MGDYLHARETKKNTSIELWPRLRQFEIGRENTTKASDPYFWPSTKYPGIMSSDLSWNTVRLSGT